MHTLTSTELADWLANGRTPLPKTKEKPCLLDVREVWEIELAHIPDSVSITLGKLPEQYDSLHTRASKDTPIVCICHHGVRSAHAARFLEEQGFSNVFNLRGGIDAWAREIDKTMATY